MGKILTVLLAICLSMGMTACSRQEGVSASSSQTEQSASESQSQPAPVPSSEAKEPELPESAASSLETESEASSSTPEPVAPPAKNITVQPISMTSVHEAFSITDNSDQDSVRSYFDRMQPCDPNPQTGGYVFEIEMTNGDIQEHYSLLSGTDDNGNSYVVKEKQWYIANHNLWLLVAAYYPKFDYENNPPEYRLEIMSKSKNSGMGLAFYSDPLLVWSEAEQEKAANILAYVDASQPMDGNMDVADTEKNIIEIYIYENDIERKCLCYDLYDDRGNCIVQYEGERIVEKGRIELPPYTKGGWFIADAGFYKYLDSLF